MKITLLILLVCLSSCAITKKNISKDIFWEDNYAIQHNAMTPSKNDTTIKAKVDNEWQEFNLVDLPQEFMDWNKAKRIETIEQIKEMIISKYGGAPDLAGPHNGIVASVGFKRDDATFSLNNAVKGIGFVPKQSKIKQVIKQLENTIDNPILEKLNILNSFYEQADTLFALDRQVSLELYSTSEHMTQTFLNQMYNPISTIVFLDMKSYKLKTIVRLLDPNNPDLNDYEKDVVRYVNLVHSYFHGKFSKEFITTIYFVNQVYNNSPAGISENGMGRRVVPSFP